MTFWLLVALEWLHILFAIFWFGSSLTTHIILVPVLASLPADAQRSWVHAFGKRYGPLVGRVGALVLLLGIGRGIAGGVLGLLTTPYGLTWIAAIVMTIGLAGIGAGLVGRTAGRLAETPSGPDWNPILDRLRRYGRLELGVFGLIFTLMIAMRFGY